MPTFTPTTQPDQTIPIVAEGGHEARYSLWRYFQGHIPSSYIVVIAAGVANASPGYATPSVDQMNAADAGSGVAGRAVFHGGYTYTVTSGEDTILTAAGYTVT